MIFFNKLSKIILLVALFLMRFESKAQSSKPFVLGVIEEFYSNILSENRVLNIYLPEGYKANDTTRYPVIYLLDGSANEDFIHVVGLIQYNNFDWIDRVPKSIVVGIANIDRKRDFTFPTKIQEDKNKFPSAGKSAKFIDFIEKELQPFIEANYKASNERTIIGESLGGLLATEILLTRPSLFNKYIIVSPSIWWDNGSILEKDSEIMKLQYSKATDIYIGVGKEGLCPTKTPRVMEVDANVLSDKLKKSESKNVHVYFDYLPEENHASVTHQAIFNALRMLYPKKK